MESKRPQGQKAKKTGLPYAPGNLCYGVPCGASCKRTGKPCMAPAMKNGRCRLHGGKSTGPKTPEGRERSHKANWKHGEYSRETFEEKRALRQGTKLLLNPNAFLNISPNEIQRHQAALARLLDKIQCGLVKPFRQVQR